MQAMSKHMPVMLVSKLDQYLERKNERIRRDGIMTGLSGLFLLISGIWQLASNPGAWFSATFMLVGAFILFMASMWDMFAYRRSLSRKTENTRLASAAETDKLKANAPQQIPPTGVTERTTQHLQGC
jgi:hypothetical protein